MQKESITWFGQWMTMDIWENRNGGYFWGYWVDGDRNSPGICNAPLPKNVVKLPVDWEVTAMWGDYAFTRDGKVMYNDVEVASWLGEVYDVTTFDSKVVRCTDTTLGKIDIDHVDVTAWSRDGASSIDKARQAISFWSYTNYPVWDKYNRWSIHLLEYYWNLFIAWGHKVQQLDSVFVLTDLLTKLPWNIVWMTATAYSWWNINIYTSEWRQLIRNWTSENPYETIKRGEKIILASGVWELDIVMTWDSKNNSAYWIVQGYEKRLIHTNNQEYLRDYDSTELYRHHHKLVARYRNYVYLPLSIVKHEDKFFNYGVMRYNISDWSSDVIIHQVDGESIQSKWLSCINKINCIHIWDDGKLRACLWVVEEEEQRSYLQSIETTEYLATEKTTKWTFVTRTVDGGNVNQTKRLQEIDIYGSIPTWSIKITAWVNHGINHRVWPLEIPIIEASYWDLHNQDTANKPQKRRYSTKLDIEFQQINFKVEIEQDKDAQETILYQINVWYEPIDR